MSDKPIRKTRVFRSQELIRVKNGSLTYYMAHELKDMGAPIEFNILNIDLKPEDIKITGYMKDRIKMDGSHEFIFQPTEQSE